MSIIPNRDIKTLGDYTITEDGVIISHPRPYKLRGGKIGYTKEMVLKQTVQNGYHIVTIHLEGKKIQTKTHRLVAKLWIPNPENKPAVNHIDGNKDNNHYTNLEWCTNAENNYHAYRTGLKNNSGEHNAFSKLTDVQVVEILKLEGKLFQREIGEIFNVSRSCIKNVLAGGWKHIDRNSIKQLDL